MELSYSEKIRRNEILKYDFVGKLPILKAIQRLPQCTPSLRNIVLKIINVINNKETYSTDALESCKIQIIGIENKLGGFIKKTKEPVTTVKAKTSKVISKFSDGPEEISNCPDVMPKRINFSIRPVKSKEEVYREVKRKLAHTESFDKNKQKSSIIDDTHKDKSKLPDTIMSDSFKQNLMEEIQKEAAAFTLSESSTATIDREQYKQNILEKLKTAKIVKKLPAPKENSTKNNIEDQQKSGDISKTSSESNLNQENCDEKSTETNLDCEKSYPDANTDRQPSKSQDQNVTLQDTFVSTSNTTKSDMNKVKHPKYIVAKPSNKISKNLGQSSKLDEGHNKPPAALQSKGHFSGNSLNKITSDKTVKSIITTSGITQKSSERVESLKKMVQKSLEKPRQSNIYTEDVVVHNKSPAALKINDESNANCLNEISSDNTSGTSNSTQEVIDEVEHLKEKFKNLPDAIPNKHTSQFENNLKAYEESKNESFAVSINNTTEKILDSDENEDVDNDEERILVTLEISENQQNRYEKRKRKAPKRRYDEIRRSKRLKEINLQIKSEVQEESHDLPTDIASANAANLSTTHEETIISDNNCENTIVPVDELKKEVLETDIPVLNTPVIENSEPEQFTESLFSDIKKEYFSDDLNDDTNVELNGEVVVKYEDMSMFDSTDFESKNMLSHHTSSETELKIKEEPIELTNEDIEQARINIENLSFVNHRLCFQLCCNHCRFSTIDRVLLVEHLKMHNNVNWTGFCSACDAHVIGYDANIIEEFYHMMKVHVKDQDFISLENKSDEKVIPFLKIKNLIGDNLSSNK